MNALAVAVHRNRVAASVASDFLALLGDFDFRIGETPPVSDMPRLSALAARHQLTAYDVAYLDLALRMSLPLATEDEHLKKAALAERVTIL